MIILDTRNDYEVKMGKFKGAIDLDLKSFVDFMDKVKEWDQDRKQTIVRSGRMGPCL